MTITIQIDTCSALRASLHTLRSLEYAGSYYDATLVLDEYGYGRSPEAFDAFIADLSPLLPPVEKKGRVLPGAGWHLTAPAMAQVCRSLREQVRLAGNARERSRVMDVLRAKMGDVLDDLAVFFGDGYAKAQPRKRRGRR